jgi:hypothetical protein
MFVQKAYLKVLEREHTRQTYGCTLALRLLRNYFMAEQITVESFK